MLSIGLDRDSASLVFSRGTTPQTMIAENTDVLFKLPVSLKPGIRWRRSILAESTTGGHQHSRSKRQTSVGDGRKVKPNLRNAKPYPTIFHLSGHRRKTSEEKRHNNSINYEESTEAKNYNPNYGVLCY